jgi:hypothetical protein
MNVFAKEEESCRITNDIHFELVKDGENFNNSHKEARKHLS